MDPLRYHQTRTVKTVYQSERDGCDSHCIQGPTGSGKSRVTAQFLIDGTRQVALTHRRVLLDQWARVLQSYDISFGFRCADRPTNFDATVQLGMLQSEYANAHKGTSHRWPLHTGCKRLHIDEVHECSADTATKIVYGYKAIGSKFIGSSATPVEVSHVCKKQIVMATYAELWESGYLVPPLPFTPDGPGLEALSRITRNENGEFSVAGLQKFWNCQTIFGRVLTNYHAINPTGKPTVLFAQGVKESLWFAQRLTEQGVPAAHIDGDCVWLHGEQLKSTPESRDLVFDGLKDGSIKVVCNRFVLREGWDMPEIGHIILACIVGTRAPFMQMVGRGLRPAEGKEYCTVQDHGGNFWRWPVEDFDEPWDMDTKRGTLEKIREMILRGDSNEHREHKEREPIVCPKCKAMRISGDACPVCGHRWLKRGRPVIQMNGQLVLEDGPMYVPRKIREGVDDAKRWKNAYYAAFKNNPSRTPEQIYSFFAFNNNWRWLPRNLPLMPIRDRHWFTPVKDLTLQDLIS